MAFRVAGWRFGYDVDHACGHILPIKGRLRSFQHLDARNIDQIVDAQPRSRHIDPVDEKTNVRLKCWDISVRSNAADAIALRERRSEEHTSELQSLMRISYAVFCLKKKNIKNVIT